MILKLSQINKAPVNPGSTTVKVRCPACRQRGTFEAFDNLPDLSAQRLENPTYIRFGQRMCPDPECGAHLFFAFDVQTKKLLGTYPAERIDFDATNLPSTVLESLEEAIACHANQCFIAAAIMVRKTLEELCDDRGATGQNLKERVKQLGTKVVLPQELLDGLDDLRLLGNDAAHIESQKFNQVGPEEVETSLEFAKEVLKATYQYSALLSRLRSLKKAQTS
jgi:hypothetical protein